MRSIIITALCCIAASKAAHIINADDFKEDLEINKPKLGFDISSLIKGFGYPFEKHSVTTEDGYIMEIHRIPHGQTDNGNNTEDRPVVLVMHGLLGSSADFFHIGVGKSLPLRLADVGYDVWVGNNRGNTYGTGHTTLDPKKNDSFWDFSLHELGQYDAPAIVDYILNTTKSEQLSFVGHSTGATQFFIMAATQPEYNDKIKVVTALAPIVYVQHSSSVLLRLINPNDYVMVLALEKAMKLLSFLSHSVVIDVALELACKDGSKYQEICAAVLFLIQGFDSNELNRAILPKFFQTFPAGISVKELNHFFQTRMSGEFKQFDYGIINNFENYNQTTPPVYNLSDVSAPVGIFYGQNDLIVTKKDVDQLADELPNVIENYVIEYPKFNHLDFLLATDVDTLANIYIINTLNSYNDLPALPVPDKTTTSTPEPTTSTPEPTTSATSITPTTSTPSPSSSSVAVISHVIVFLQVLVGIVVYSRYSF